MKKRFISLNFAAVVATIFLAANPGVMRETAAPSSAASPASAQAPPQPAPPPKLDPRAEQLLSRSCEDRASSRAFTFHAEITFDKVLPSNVKLQFAAAADYAVQRPDQLAVEFHSDLGGKEIWYDGTNVTMFDPPHMLYASIEVPASIDGMMEQLETAQTSPIPLADLAYSHPCEMFRKGIVFSGYIGVNDAAGEDCDHGGVFRERCRSGKLATTHWKASPAQSCNQLSQCSRFAGVRRGSVGLEIPGEHSGERLSP